VNHLGKSMRDHRTQAVRDLFGLPAIGAKLFSVNAQNSLTDCFDITKKCGIDAAE
jgi:hypothetical protein